MLAIKRKIQENATKRKVKPKHVALLSAAVQSWQLVAELGKKISGYEDRITVDRLMAMSEELCPSLLFPEGGLLFDFFFLSQGSVTAHEKLNKMIQDGVPECQVRRTEVSVARSVLVIHTCICLFLHTMIERPLVLSSCTHFFVISLLSSLLLLFSCSPLCERTFAEYACVHLTCGFTVVFPLFSRFSCLWI